MEERYHFAETIRSETKLWKLRTISKLWE